jgi:hypothetical protein
MAFFCDLQPTRLYFCDRRVVDVVREMKPFVRGDAEPLLRLGEPMKGTAYRQYLIR